MIAHPCLPSCSTGSRYLGGMRFEVSLLGTPLLRPEHEPVSSFWECAEYRNSKANFPKMGKITLPLLAGSTEITYICSTFHAKGKEAGALHSENSRVLLSVGLLRAKGQWPGPDAARQLSQTQGERNPARAQ